MLGAICIISSESWASSHLTIARRENIWNDRKMSIMGMHRRLSEARQRANAGRAVSDTGQGISRVSGHAAGERPRSPGGTVCVILHPNRGLDGPAIRGTSDHGK